MTTPLTTITDALIEFILSLLRDPAAAAEFEADPDATLARKGLSNVCVEDVRSVVPVIVDHPAVTPRPVQPPPTIIVEAPAVRPHPEPPPVVREIMNVANNFDIDNRTTIVDQSVNQSIWAHGDVTQYFDQQAVLAAGDNSVAAGHDATVDNSSTDITTGDVAIGNTETTTEVNDSFNDSSADTTVTADITDSFDDSSTDTTVTADITDSFNDSSATSVDTDVNQSFQADSATVVISPIEDAESYSESTLTIIDDTPADLELEES